jgi:ATP-dependent helicase YprA (DUF1998 family)
VGDDLAEEAHVFLGQVKAAGIHGRHVEVLDFRRRRSRVRRISR